MSLGRIIRKRRHELDVTLDEVSAKTGFSKPYLSTIETGKVKNPPGDRLLRKLEDVLKFNPGELRYIANLDRTPADVRQSFEASQEENQRWRKLIKALGDKKDSNKINELLAESELKVDSNKPEVKPGKLIPVINRVAAGYPADFDDLDYPAGFADDYVRCPDVDDPGAFAVCVVGDSMEPKFVEGDIVIFSPAVQVRSGDDCFVRLATPHETTFKRVFFESEDKIRLQPRNENYAPMIVEGSKINGLYRAIVKYERL
ncbi:MAG: helix-turn-helix domain-containing protein [Sedimentisphaerales bacterium]|nr:helix-turn-helix domain-containing protein [Sedimentisphaerales bacterium]